MYKRYERYKDSGIEWIGEIPEHWEEIKLKYMAYVKSSNVDKKIEEDEQEVLLCNYTDVYYNDTIDSNIEFMKATAKSEEIDKFELQSGDVIITKDSETWDDIAVPAYVPYKFDKVICGYHLALVRSFSNKSLGRYIFRAFSSDGIRDQFMVSANGITRFGLSISSIKSALFPCPPLHEQKNIANFLDHKTSEIDSLIVDKEELIKKLEEYKQSIISEAVTKGLNPDVRMKDSGIEWIGEIPEHWDIKKVKHLTSYIGSGKTPRGGSEIYSDTGVLFLRSQNVYSHGLKLTDRVYISEEIDFEMRNTRVKSLDILLNITGASIGRSSIVPEVFQKANVNQHVCIIRPLLDKVIPSLLHKHIMSKMVQDQIFMHQNGSSREGLNFVQVANLVLAMPPIIKEQEELSCSLDEIIVSTEALIQGILEGIKTLKLYRQALIYEAVTGKIDVRDYQSERSEKLA
jgi:type I restriction enzyme, S subunit